MNIRNKQTSNSIMSSSTEIVKAASQKCKISKPEKERETATDKGKSPIMWKVHA